MRIWAIQNDETDPPHLAGRWLQEQGHEIVVLKAYSGEKVPTTEIACWFVDTDYNGESFFVRHAYFTGADKPMEKLQKALKTDIDEEAWSSMYGTVSRPFKSPTHKKVAIKVINHYGDEVLKVFSIN
ncbi:MAG: hypothetical protein D4S00_04490 [Streptomycetaceae bacterium]|nr:MAG: hypothetical protein D4S00_04490 [Streptomycetaceae bacterium]